MHLANTAMWDRLLRLAFGLLLAVYCFTGPIDMANLATRVLLPYPLLTGLMGFCPIYSVLGYRTRPRD
ncbi:MAG: DUF2892 domain-containing protein [Acidobacteriota bacterium]